MIPIHHSKAFIVFHELIKFDSKLEKQCLIWEARYRLGELGNRPRNSRYAVLCEDLPEFVLSISQSFTLFDLQRQVRVGEPVVQISDPGEGTYWTHLFLERAGLYVYINIKNASSNKDSPASEKYHRLRNGVRYTLRMNAEGLSEVIITEKYSLREERYRPTHPNGTFKRGA